MVAIATVALLLLIEQGAMANSIDLHREGRPGEGVVVRGHGWATCCSPITPREHLQLFLVGHDTRLLLVEVKATARGRFATSFEVPSVEPGRYELQACERPGNEEATLCVPEGRFVVLRGSPSPSPLPTQTSPAVAGASDEATSDAVPVGLMAGGAAAGVAAVSAVAYLMLRRRARSRVAATSEVR